MSSWKHRGWTMAFVVALASLLSACGGGGTTTPPLIGPEFSLILTADPDVGTAPLTVSFFVVPSGGTAPYTYAWDFNGDGVIDSNAPNGTYTYADSGQASVTVTDASDRTVVGQKTVIVTGDTVQPDPNVLDVRFNASPQVGNVPFSCQFTSYVSGGKAPYSYAWDFNGDGVFDSYLPNPLYTFEKIGQPVGAGTYVIYPVLQVTDGRGVIGTNLDDKDGDSNPDFKMAINVLPAEGGIVVAATANPLTGQAPLSVEFTGAVTAGSGNYEYSWSFGDGETTPFAKTSLASHTYLAAGTYLATVTVHDVTTDDSATSEPLTITATVEQAFELTIISDITEGQVPFVVSFGANPTNGKEPIEYQWDIFTDDAIDPEPSLSTPPFLAAEAVVTPDFTYRKNPTIHFANTAETGAPYNYIARCVGRDSAGNEAVSNLIRVTATPNQTLPYYEAHRPSQVGASFFEACGGPG